MALMLAGGDRSARLHEVIGAADATNHAIPTTQELSRALTKFVQYGVATVTGDLYSITPECLPDIKKAYKGKGGLFASGDKGLKFLQSTEFLQKSDSCIELSDVEVDSAYKLYLKAIREK